MCTARGTRVDGRNKHGKHPQASSLITIPPPPNTLGSNDQPQLLKLTVTTASKTVMPGGTPKRKRYEPSPSDPVLKIGSLPPKATFGEVLNAIKEAYKGPFDLKMEPSPTVTLPQRVIRILTEKVQVPTTLLSCASLHTLLSSKYTSASIV